MPMLLLTCRQLAVNLPASQPCSTFSSVDPTAKKVTRILNKDVFSQSHRFLPLLPRLYDFCFFLRCALPTPIFGKKIPVPLQIYPFSPLQYRLKSYIIGGRNRSVRFSDGFGRFFFFNVTFGRIAMENFDNLKKTPLFEKH